MEAVGPPARIAAEAIAASRSVEIVAAESHARPQARRWEVRPEIAITDLTKISLE